MTRGRYAKVTTRNASVLARIRELKADHPFWGYRRIWAHLKFVDGHVIGQNRVHRLMKAHDLLVPPNMKIKAKRTANTKKPKPERPNQWWGIDMTKVMIDGFGWVYVVIVIDWYTKKVVGHYGGVRSKAWHWLIALNKAVNRQFPNGARGHGVHLMADNGCQPTAISFMQACAALEIKQAFTSYNNPKGNADTERFMRTLKEELVWSNEWASPAAFFDARDVWIDEYNENYLHSALGYKPPARFENETLASMTHLKHAC